MNYFLSEIAGRAVQLLLFTLFPFIFWLLKRRKEEKFTRWIGLKKMRSDKNKNLIYTITGTSFLFMLLSLSVFLILKDVSFAQSELSGLKFSAIPSILIFSVFKTSLSEEIFFRGFLLKQLAAWLGFSRGNLIQSLLFGLLHGVMLFNIAGLTKTLAVILFTSLIGWIVGYIDEKKAGGSIIPGWIIHASANIFSSLLSAFSVI